MALGFHVEAPHGGKMAAAAPISPLLRLKASRPEACFHEEEGWWAIPVGILPSSELCGVSLQGTALMLGEHLAVGVREAPAALERGRPRASKQQRPLGGMAPVLSLVSKASGSALLPRWWGPGREGAPSPPAWVWVLCQE